MNDLVRILIVDDEMQILKALKRLLRGEEFDIITTTDPFEALELVKHAQIDIVISDHLMPGMDGITLLSKIKELRPDTIRIVLTGHAQLDMAIEAINKGSVYKFFTKPWDDSTLLNELRIAARLIKLERENMRLKAELEKQSRFLEELEKRHPGITRVERDEKGRIVIKDFEE